MILELLRYPDIESLTMEELCVPIIYGHNHACLDLCAEKILRLRQGASIRDILENPAEDLATNRPSRSVDSRITDLKDVANTFKNCLQAACLIIVEKADGRQQISFNQDMEAEYESALAEKDRFIPNPENEESFQRSYGAWDRNKDTRRLVPAREVDESAAEDAIISSQFFRHCGLRPVTDIPEDLVSSIRRDFGFPEDRIRQVFQRLMPKALDVFESTFLELAAGGAPAATRFEEAVANIFQNRLHVDADLTGQRKRPTGSKGGYSDVLLRRTAPLACAIVDAKATMSYSLGSSDFYKMTANYIPNYSELFPDSPPPLQFSAYVAGGFVSTINDALRKVKDAAQVPCSAMKARELLAVARRHPVPSPDAVFSAFSMGRLITSTDIGGGS